MIVYRIGNNHCCCGFFLLSINIIKHTIIKFPMFPTRRKPQKYLLLPFIVRPEMVKKAGYETLKNG